MHTPSPAALGPDGLHPRGRLGVAGALRAQDAREMERTVRELLTAAQQERKAKLDARAGLILCSR